MKLIFTASLMLIIYLKCSALNIVQIAKINIPITITQPTFCKIISVNKEGAFLSYVFVQARLNSGVRYGDAILGICVKNDGSHVFFQPYYSGENIKTNVIDIGFESGSNFYILDEVTTFTTIKNSGTTILRSINHLGHLSENIIDVTTATTRYKVSNSSTTIIGSSNKFISRTSEITKFDKTGNRKDTVKLTGYSSSGEFSLTSLPDDIYGSSTDHNEKFIYSSSIEDGCAVFYKIIDEETLSPNRITLGSSQNGSLIATVNNPEQALLNIQSSTNLIDWNTFKTIKNEPSLEIVVPANKKQEFIRAIE
jgi:hypothetical protein